MRGRGAFCKRVPSPTPLLSPSQDFRPYRIPVASFPGLFININILLSINKNDMLRHERTGAYHWLIGTKRAGDGHKAISRLAARPPSTRYKSLWGWRMDFGKEGRAFLQKGPPSQFTPLHSRFPPRPRETAQLGPEGIDAAHVLEETGRGMMPLSKRLHSLARCVRPACTCRPWSGRAKAEYRARARSPRSRSMPAAESGSRAAGLRP